MTKKEEEQLKEIIKLFLTRVDIEQCGGMPENAQAIIGLLRVCSKYTLFNLNATKLELDFVTKQLKEG